MTTLEIILCCTTVLFGGLFVFAHVRWMGALVGWSRSLERNRELIEMVQQQRDYIFDLETDDFETVETMQ